MLVERLQVCLGRFKIRLGANPRFAGIGYQLIQTGTRSHQRQDKDVDVFHDGGTEAAQVPATALCHPHRSVRPMARWRRQSE